MLVVTKSEILVLPFEAQGAMIDKIGRSLMSRLLVENLALRTTEFVSDFDLVDRALGHERPRHLLLRSS